MDLDALLGALDVDGADGRGAGRDAGDVAGLTEHAVQGVLGDGQGMQGDQTGLQIEPLLDVVTDELGHGVDKRRVAGPAGAGGDDVGAALGDVVDDLGIAVDVLVGGVVDVLQRHTQLGVDLIDEVLQHGVSETGLIGLGGDVALIVGPLVLGEHEHLGAVDLEVVDQLSQGDVGLRLGVAQDHGEGATGLGGGLQAGEQGGDQHGMGVHHDLDVKVGMPPRLALLQLGTGQLAHALALLAVLEGNVVAGLKIELGRGVEDDVFHNDLPF